MVGELVGKCRGAEGASDSDVQGAMAYLPPTTRPGKCFHACIMETLGIVRTFFLLFTLTFLMTI